MLWNMIKEKMLLHPSQTVWEGDAFLTYEQIVVLAEKTAAKLPRSCCGILCKSELFGGIALLACLAAGVTAVPLSYKYGQAHLRTLLEFIHPPYILSDAGGQLTLMDTDTGEYAEPAEGTALILCTSGSTGKPKGVMLSETNLAANLLGIATYFGIFENDTILISRPLYHCAVLMGEFLISLYKGLRIRFLGGAYQPNRVLHLLRTEGVTVMGGTPTLFSLLGNLLEGREELAALTKIALSGECMTPSAVRQIHRAFGTAEIYHVYGLTEASPRVAYLPPAEFEQFGCTLRHALPGVELNIVDSAGKSVHVGENGELLVRGPGVMLGYYKNPDRTATILRDGWLHTGDIARLDANGRFQIRGRIDDMIIRAGMNIYPAEIENLLRTDSAIRDVVAYGISDSRQNTQVGIRVVGENLSKQSVMQICRRILPDYAMPSSIEITDEIPKNGSGKAIRRAKQIEGELK